jgi:hypothetical protein
MPLCCAQGATPTGTAPSDGAARGKKAGPLAFVLALVPVVPSAVQHPSRHSSVELLLLPLLLLLPPRGKHALVHHDAPRPSNGAVDDDSACRQLCVRQGGHRRLRQKAGGREERGAGRWRTITPKGPSPQANRMRRV